jgi:hypothetical protein
MWMNRFDIEIAAENCAGHPVLGPATRFLKALMESVDQQSDGWPYWSAPSKSAEKLMELIKQNTGGMWHPSSSTFITLKDVTKAIIPIRKMVVTQKEKQKQYGNKYDFDCDAAWKEALDN